MARCKAVEIARFLNFPGAGFRGRRWRKLVELARKLPRGEQRPWGIPFRMSPEGAAARAILLREDAEARIPIRARADYVCVLHTFAKLEDDPTAYAEAGRLGEYALIYADGSSHCQPIRARIEIMIPESPGPAQLAVPFQMPLPIDPAAPSPGEFKALPPGPTESRWGVRQCGIYTAGDGPLLYAIQNPNPEKTVLELVIRGLVESPILIAGVTAWRGTAHPLRHLARRMYRLRKAGGVPVKVWSLEVDMGAVARVDHTLGARGKAWLRSPYAGLTTAEEPERNGEDIFSIYGARDATVSARLAGRAAPVEFSLGEAYDSGICRRREILLERLGGAKQWMQVEILDSATGRPTPARLHISGLAGEYVAPYGHHEQINANWFEDYGADVKVGGRSYAYVPGRFFTDLPAGELYVELFKGFEYEPTRCKVTVHPGQKKLTLRIRRWKDLRSKGWLTADTHVHFISPQTAWLEAQCEGVNVVNLLASQWGRLFTNVGDISGRVGVVEGDTIVWVGTENRHHMLGHISMLGTKGLPVFPMCSGGVSESWMGDPEFRTLVEWAQECRRKDGLVIRPHFPYCGFTEDPALAVTGAMDAVEIAVGAAPRNDFALQEWYRYLNNGYRVAVVGGTDKMGAYCALGHLRTYAQLDPEQAFTYENWARAVRAGRTYSTTGPLLELTVEGRRIGETIRLPAGGGRLQVEALAESAWPLGRIEIVQNGRPVASESSRLGGKKIAVSAKLSVSGSGWIAARCSGAQQTPAGYMAAHTSPIYVLCGRQKAFDGPALEHMLNLTRGGIEYLETLATRFSDRDQERMIRIYRDVERRLMRRLAEHRRY